MMTTRNGQVCPLVAALALAWSIAAPGPVAGQASPAKAEAKDAGWLPILRGQADDYRIADRDAPERPFRRVAEPLLRWTQPVRGGDDGAVFLWTADDGRPGAIGTIFTWRANGPRILQHELHSLAERPIVATWRGEDAWHPGAAGLSFGPVPDAPEPAATAAARGRQMQAIARNFGGSSLHDQSGRNELRLLPRPLHRYEAGAAGVVDGAVFALAHGTDPEAFLLIEAARPGGGNGPPSYRYGLARFSDLALAVTFKGREVWSVPPGVMTVRDRPHLYFNAESVDAETPEDYRKLKPGR